MSEGESRFTLTLMHKLLIGAAAGFFMLAIGGYFVYAKFIAGAKPAAIKPADLEKIQFEAQDSITFDEFSIFLTEGEKKGLVKFKVNAEVAGTRVKEFLDRSKPAVRDAITRTIMKMKLGEVKLKYADLSLHEIIRKDLNSIVDRSVKNNKDPEGKIREMNLVVRVSVFDFSAVEIE